MHIGIVCRSVCDHCVQEYMIAVGNLLVMRYTISHDATPGCWHRLVGDGLEDSIAQNVSYHLVQHSFGFLSSSLIFIITTFCFFLLSLYYYYYYFFFCCWLFSPVVLLMLVSETSCSVLSEDTTAYNPSLVNQLIFVYISVAFHWYSSEGSFAGQASFESLHD